VALSDPRVISLLNRYFVPVYLANADYGEKGAAPAAEKAELRRIRQEGHAAKLSVGSVHAYLLGPDGHLRDTRHVAQAYKADALVAMLEKAVKELGTQAGEPVAAPAAQSVARAAPEALLLHVTARYLQREGDQYRLIESAGGDWSAFPGEDWIPLERSASLKLLPPASVRPGESWEPDREVVAELLNRFYPPTENNDLQKNRIDEQSLRGTLLSTAGGVAKARLEGAFKMKHPFYHKDDGKFARAKLYGTLEWETKGPRVRSLRLVTDEGTYGAEGERGQPFGVALRTVDEQGEKR